MKDSRRRQLARLDARTRWLRARIPTDTWQALEAASEARNVPVSQLVCHAINEFLPRLDDPDLVVEKYRWARQR